MGSLKDLFSILALQQKHVISIVIKHKKKNLPLTLYRLFGFELRRSHIFKVNMYRVVSRLIWYKTHKPLDIENEMP